MSTSVCPQCRSPMTGKAAGQYCPRCAGRLLLESGGADDDTLDAPPPPAGLRLGEYELGTELGRGAMGVVYRARQPRLKREVAVKVILASRFAGEATRKRFLAEAELAAQLDHPNIVPIYEVGDTPDGPFYVMKLVEGGTLAERMRGAECETRDQEDASAGSAKTPHSAFRTPQSAGLLAKIARAVHHAHQRGVLHRDLKPGNILIDAEGEPHVTDFGLARQLGVENSLTLSGSPLGTPAYMSPEQTRGEKGISTASDVWSLGAILYHLLAGRPPFMGTTAVEVLRKVAEEDPVPPSRPNAECGMRSAESAGPPTHRLYSTFHLSHSAFKDLETICLKCLEKDPARRYASALALAEDLERWLKHEPILARPSTALERLGKWAGRHPAVASLSLLAGLLVVLGTIGVTWQWWRAEHHRALAEQSRLHTQQANEALLSMISRLEHERAEQFFQAGDSSRGVALLAKIVRRDPASRHASERLLSALVYRPFAVPEREWAPLDAAILSALPGNGRLRLSAIYNQSEVRLYDGASGQAIGPKFLQNRGGPPPRFAPDGGLVALAVSNNAVELRHATNGDWIAGPLRHSPQAGAVITTIRFTPTGTSLLTTSSDGTARIWSLPAGTAMSEPLQLEQPVQDADVSADGRRVVLLARDGEITVWDAGTAKVLGRHPAGLPIARAVRWSHDGSFLAVLCGDQRLEWRKPLQGRVERAWLAPEKVAALSCGSEDHSVLLQGSTTAFLWDATTGQLAAEPFPRRAAGGGLDLPPEQERVQAVSRNGIVRSWRRRPALTATAALHGDGLVSVRSTEDGTKLLSVGTNNQAALWSTGRLEPLASPFNLGGKFLDCGPDAAQLLVASNTTAWLVETRTGARIGSSFQENEFVLAGALQPASQRVALSKADKSFSFWDASTSSQLWFDRSFPYKINGMVFSANGQWLAARWGVYVTLGHQGRLHNPNLKHNGFVEDMSFSADGNLLATAARDYSARLWSVPHRSERFRLEHEGPVSRVVFSRDGRWLSTIAWVREHKAFVWNAANGQRLGEALAHPGHVLDVAFDAESRRLATAGEDGTVRLWDAATGLALSEPLRHGRPVRSVSFTASDNRLATACDDGRARLWPLPPAHGAATQPGWLPALAEALVGARFTATDTFELTPWKETTNAFTNLRLAAEQDAEARWLRSLLWPDSGPPIN